jgi:hypothetical protein
MCLSKSKNEYLKYRSSDKKRFVASDVIPLVNMSWEGSFGRAATAKRAIINRGWGPLNYKLLDHPQLIGVNDAEVVEDNSVVGVAASALLDIASINTSGTRFNGFVDLFVKESIKDEGRRKKHEEYVQATKVREEGFSKLSNIARLSSGQLGVAGHYNLDEEVYQKVKLRQQEQDIKLQNAMQKREDSKKKANQKFNDAFAKYKANNQILRADDYKQLLRKIHRKNDSPIRTKITELQNQFRTREQRLFGMVVDDRCNRSCGDNMLFSDERTTIVPQFTVESYLLPESGVENSDEINLTIAL